MSTIAPVQQGRASQAPHPAHAPGPRRTRAPRRIPWLPILAIASLAAGVLVGLARPEPGLWILRIGLVATGTPLLVRTVVGMLRGRFAADIVAAMAIAGALLLDQPLAGLVIVLMQSGGEALERYAEGRASRALRELEARAPRVAHRMAIEGGATEDVPVERIAVGDLLLVRAGEMIPADAVVVDGDSHVDTSAITGEPMPLHGRPGTRLPSGSLNGEGALTVRAAARAAESQYARIVELVRDAQASKAPIQRVADRAAIWFTPATILVSVATYLLTGDPLRVLAVLVVATPCPLILATPVAIIGGISRAAREHVIVRRGGALETLARVDHAVFDKTGTLTVGTPRVARVVPANGRTAADALRLAAAVERGSTHVVARAILDAAAAAELVPPPSTGLRETPGRGIVGTVDGSAVHVGSLSYLREVAPDAAAEIEARPAGDGLRAYLAVDGRLAATVELADQVRPGLRPFFEELERLGVRDRILLSGDHAAHAREIGAALGFTDARGELLPGDKVDIVRGLVEDGRVVAMMGDGTNDAPALSTASVGIALAGPGHGGGITAEAADVVFLGDDPTWLASAIRVARRTMRVARQSIFVGIGLSATAMVFAAFGYIAPAVGALIQEAIDVAVIVNALRASR